MILLPLNEKMPTSPSVPGALPLYVAPSAYEVFFASAAHDAALLRETAEAMKDALRVAFEEAA